MKYCAFAFIATATLWAAHALGDASHSIQTYELTLHEQAYVPCLGQVITADSFFEGRFHEFETKSGTIHVLDYAHFVQYISDPLGRQWVAKGEAPFEQNITLTKGEVWQFTGHSLYFPLTEDTPKIQFQNTMKVTFDANGELRVFHDVYPFERIFRCLPN